MQKGVSLAACTAPCRRQPCACQRCDRSPAFQPRSSGPRLHRGRAAAAGGRFGSAGGLSSPSSEDAYAQELEAHLREAGQHDGEGPDPQHVRRLAAAAHWLAASADVAPHAALWLVVEHEHSMAACDLHASLAPKFELFRRLCAADPGSGTALAAALRSSPGGAALALPPAAFAAALHFTAAQLQRLSRGRYEQLHRPYSLLRFVQLHPDLAGGLLSQHPGGFERHAAPWLQQRLGWGEAALADAALSPCLPQLCQLDVRHAQRCLDWLLALGLTPPEAGRLLAADARLLAGPPAQLEAAAARVAELAEAWDVAPRLAAALALTQPWLTATMADRTAALLRALKVRACGGTAGLSMRV